MSDLRSRIRAAAAHWRLTIGEELKGGTISAVFEARDQAGRDLVLKLPDTRAAARDAVADERAALAAWDGSGGV